MKLFEPITIRGLTLKNRIVLAPMGMPFGLRGRRAEAYYLERARGGAGALISSATSPSLFASDEIWGHEGGTQEFVENVRSLPRAVHEVGGKIGVQLLHSNRWPDKGPGRAEGEPVAVSARIEGDPPTTAGLLQTGDRVRELSIQEIETIVDHHVKAAAGVKKAGFDFVELHLSHNYFNGQFFSPFYNLRKDKYGGSLEGRMRFGLECAQGIREAVGDDFPLFCRLGMEERREGGITLQESLLFATELVKAGVDVMDADPAESIPYITPGSDCLMGTFAHEAEMVKHRVDVPVIAVGRINTPEVAEAILQRGQADMVALGRQLIADPFWPQKVKEGRVDDIVPCISCNMCTAATPRYYCTVNAAATKEDQFRIAPADVPKRVWVIGGGPGGLEAARVAGLRGHKVTLFEKSDKLGGQLHVSAVPPGKDIIDNLREYMVRQVEKAGVEVRLGEEVTADSVSEGKPDAVIIAVGATPIVPNIPGIERDNVAHAEAVLAGQVKVGDSVVIVGGELVACETALYLAEQGKRVTICRRGKMILEKMEYRHRRRMQEKLVARGVVMLTGVQYERITEKGLDIVDKEGNTRTLEADAIVVAAGAKPRDELASELEGKVAILYPVGDCVEPRMIREAITDGARAGLEV
jgi:2,4-dienoyl-CoA reductase-like NADH-dependent reductase (Old Yellow Enzyme family)/thioredoxin reductase